MGASLLISNNCTIYVSVVVASPVTTPGVSKPGSAIISGNKEAPTQSINLTSTTLPPGTSSFPTTTNSTSTLCTNQSLQLHTEGRPTTPPYKRLIESINKQLTVIGNESIIDMRRQLIKHLEEEVIMLNNYLLPGHVLADLCSILTEFSEPKQLETTIDHSVVEFRNKTNHIMDTYNYTAHRLKKSDEQRLLAELLTNYEKDVRPVLRASEPVELKIGLTLNQIDVVSYVACDSTLISKQRSCAKFLLIF